MSNKKIETRIASKTYEEKVRFAAALFAVHRALLGNTAPLHRAIEATVQDTNTLTDGRFQA